MDFNHIDSLKERLDSFRPLPEAALNNLHEDMILRMTYNSNAIEGNTLTLKETKVVMEGITVGGKSLREHLEAINHRDAILYIEDIINKKESFSLRMIRNLHQLILKGIDDKNAGVWRNINVTIVGAQHIPPEFLHLDEEMNKLENWYQQEQEQLHPVELSARLHVDFVKIHPFVDGNGRTARLLMNLELMRGGFPPLIVPVEKRLDYYNALDTAHVDGDYNNFISLIAELVEKSFEPYWHALGV